MIRASASSWRAFGAYFARETAANLWRHRFASLLSVLIIASGALVFETFALLAHNVSRLVEQGGRGLFVELYFHDEVTEERQRALTEQATALPEVREAHWISKQKALESFRLAGYGPLLEGLEGNPLPASVLLELHSGLDAARGRALAVRLAEAPEFEQYSDSAELAERLAAAASLLRGLVGAAGLFLGLMLSFVVAATVRLALDARRVEIEILELVGATALFIRLPFVLEGLVLGALGGLLSVGALFALYRAVVGSLDIGHLLLLGIGSLGFFDAPALVLCCTATTALGAGAALLVTSRRLRRPLPG